MINEIGFATCTETMEKITILTKHEETILHDLVNLLREAQELGLADGELYTISDMQDEGTYDENDDHRILTEQEARAAVKNLAQARQDQGRLIDVELISECIEDAIEENEC